MYRLLGYQSLSYQSLGVVKTHVFGISLPKASSHLGLKPERLFSEAHVLGFGGVTKVHPRTQKLMGSLSFVEPTADSDRSWYDFRCPMTRGRLCLLRPQAQ